jgi:tetratricopeptide (TPR) repeat protein
MKAAKEPDFRVCPNCGARNKPKWEFCVKCSESLQGVPLGGTAPPATATAVVAEDEGSGIPWGSVAAAIVGLALAVGAYKLFRDPAPAPPPDLFTVGTIPPSLPPSHERLPKSAGQEEYEAGLRRLNANDPAGAAVYFQRAVAAASGNHVFRHAYAVALWQSGAKAESIDEYRNAVRVAPDNPTYRLNLAKALASIGRNTEALSEYEALIQRGGNLEALQEAARLLADTDPQRAQEFLRRVAATRPGVAVVKQQLASMLEKSGDTEGATKLYSEILGQNPGAHITRGLLAEIQLKRGQPEEAVALFRSGVQQYPDVPLLHRGLASALERSGAVVEAINEYREYARLAPNAPDAQQLRERADRLEKQVTAAAS